MLKTELEDEVKRLKGEVKALEDEIVRLKGAHQAFKEKIRDRMILEADRRNWCSEFDSIISEFGIRGRFGTWKVYVQLSDADGYRINRNYGMLPANWHRVDDLNFYVTLVAKNEQQARELVNNHIRQSFSRYELVKAEETI